MKNQLKVNMIDPLEEHSEDEFSSDLKPKIMAKKRLWLLRLLIPVKCAFCGKTLKMDDEPVCDDCKEQLEKLTIKPPFCPVCGLNKSECQHTGKEKRYYETCVSPFYYQDVVRNGIIRVKFSGKPSGCEYFGKLLAREINYRYSNVKFDMIIPVPMHHSSMRKRGFNQSYLIAKAIGKYLEVPVENKVLIKKFQTLEQHKVGAAERGGNVFGVFDVANSEKTKLTDKIILLVDDVATTGATINECSKMLMIYGAKMVYCVTLAKSKPKLVKL